MEPHQVKPATPALVQQYPDDEALLLLAARAGQVFFTIPANGLAYDLPYWRVFTGQSAAETAGLGWLDAVHPGDRRRVMVAWRTSVTDGSLFEVAFRLRHAEGVYHQVLARAVPWHSRDGSVRQWVGTVTDLGLHGSEVAHTTDAGAVGAGRVNTDGPASAHERIAAFLDIVAHELRTPITVIHANLQIMARQAEHSRITDGPALDEAARRRRERQRALQGRTERQVARLARLVDDLLDVSRLRTEHMELRLARCDLVEIVRDVVEGYLLMLPERGIALDIPSGPVPVMADVDRLGQVVTNYLSNALKYSRVETPVAVRVSADGAEARVEVRDYGIGIAPEEQSRVWDLFHRAPGVAVQFGSGIGLGLGLHICKSLVERHGGTVGMESALGAGSIFWFTLPLAPGA